MGEVEGLMEFFSELAEWFADPARWTGGRGIAFRLYEHVQVSVLATGLAAALGMPPAMLLAHRRRGEFIANALVNVGRAIPSFGIVVFTAVLTLKVGLGMGFWPTFTALVALALPPIFTNTYTAVAGVDPSAVESARGMGLTERQILLGIELPLGAPVVLAGLRLATVQVIATATIGAVLTFGGLGRYIIDGFAKGDSIEVFAGAVLVAVLTLVAEGAFTLGERFLLPAGVRRIVRTADVAGTAPAA